MEDVQVEVAAAVAVSSSAHSMTTQSPRMERSTAASTSTPVLAEYTERHNHEELHILKIVGAPLLNLPPSVTRALLHPLFQDTAIILICAFLTWSNATRGEHISAFLLAPSLALAAATILPQHSTSAALGGYLGMGTAAVVTSFAWLAVTALVGCALWATFIRLELFAGFSGRLGVIAFVSCNISYLLSAAVGNVRASDYVGNAGWDYVTLEVGILTVAASTLTAIATGAVRRMPGLAATALNPVAAGSAVALVLTLCILPTEYRDAASVVASIGEGSFVGMASYARLPSLGAFFLTGLLCGGVNLALVPLFGGFAGKAGFCAFLSCFLYVLGARLFRLLRQIARSSRD